MAKKKEFRENPVLAYITAQDNAPDEAHNEAHNEAHEKPQTAEFAGTQQNKYAPDEAHRKAHTEAHDNAPETAHKKYKINLGIDSKALYDRIYLQAERQGKSVTRYLNDLALNDVARADYLDKKKGGGKK